MPVVAAVAVPHPPIILPEVGKGEEAKIAETHKAYQAAMARVAAAQPQTVVIVSPHAEAYADRFHIYPGDSAWGDFARFGAPTATVEAACDPAFAQALEAEAEKQGLAASSRGNNASELDHGTTIPLVYLMREYADFKLVVVGLSGLPLADHYRLGQCIARVAEHSRVAVVGSGDLSHRLKEDGPYGFAPEGPELDRQITAALAAADFGALMELDEGLCERGAECGLRSFVIMAGALDGQRVEAELLSYQGVFGVGYAVASFAPAGQDDSRRFLAAAEGKRRRQQLNRQKKEDAYVALARYALEYTLGCGKPAPLPPGLPGELLGRCAGAFVSLHKNDELRGCIGTIAPTTQSLAHEILQNAVSAALEDPRFPPVAAGEVDFLEIKVDVLGEAEEIAGEDELDPKRYGVIVSAGARRGLLLPDLEGVDTVARQLAIARQKAGIAPGEPVRLERFEVVRHR